MPKKPTKAAKTNTAKGVVFYNVTIDAANNANGQVLPANLRRLRFRARTAVAILYAFTEAHVDGSSPPGPYSTLKSGTEFDVDGLDFGGRTLWVAGGQGVIVEVECYKQN